MMNLPTIALGILLLSGGGQHTAALLEDPGQAARFDYCDTAAPLDAGTQGLAENRLSPQREDVTEAQQAAALLIRAGAQVAAAQPNARVCRAVFARGKAMFDRALASNTRSIGRNVGRDRAEDPEIARVQTVVSDLWLADQAGRVTYSGLQTQDRNGAAFWAQRLATANAVMADARSTAALRELLDRYDWIDRHRFGAGVSSRAWILAQHADDHPDFQRTVLARMEPYLENGGIRPRDYAYLWDRVAVNTGGLQRYGTQPMAQCNPDGTLDLRPMEDPETVDARRAAMNLGPAAVDLAQMARERCRAAG
jgi:hypothetical protein